jgi:glycosyltransferase involved in cell wall biosynthesis
MGLRSDPLRILASSVAVGSSGGITVLEGLGAALTGTEGADVRIAVPAALRARLEGTIPPAALIPVEVGSTPARLWWEERALPRLARRHRVDVVLGMTNTLPVATSLRSVRVALLVQNIAPLLPEVRRMYRGIARARLEALRTLTMRGVHRADVTFLFTRYGRDLVSALAPRAHVVAIPPGGLPPTQEPFVERTVGDHVLILADLYRYKGVEQVIRAMADPRLAELRLIVAGAPMEPLYAQMLRQVATAEGMTDRVSFVGRVPRVTVIELLRTARCLVQPSHVESLALPMLEAIQLDVPVVSTDIPVARELCGDAALYFQPGDVRGLADGLLESESRPTVSGIPRMEWESTAEALVSELRVVAPSGATPYSS